MDRIGPPAASDLARQTLRLVQAIEAAGNAVLPQSNQELLQSIVEAAARIFGAAAASIALVDEEQQQLEFKVAYGAGNAKLVGMRFPLDQGIAGYVIMTGQPIAVSNVQQDTRFHQEFAESTGYVPRSILAMPLFSGEQVIGVMEVLDKINAPSFGMQDMDLLGIFARQAAIAIHQSQMVDGLGAALKDGIRRNLLASVSRETGGKSADLELILALDQPGSDESGRQELLALARLFNEISQLGEAERNTCLSILKTFAQYAQSRSKLGL